MPVVQSEVPYFNDSLSSAFNAHTFVMGCNASKHDNLSQCDLSTVASLMNKSGTPLSDCGNISAYKK